jgi:hexose-6-phosphate dehydrogenase
VFEKPFGSDVQSAIELADTLGESLEEEEIYRIDHYLGKAGVRVIHAFRAQNKDIYEALLTTEHVAYVDVVMKEQTDCAGRAGYYDDYGVVRDLHQNHLSEMMALALMDLPLDTQVLEDSTKTVQQQQSQLMAMYKAYCYDAIKKPSLAQDVVVGQYEGYQKHVEQDRAKWMTDPNDIKRRTVTPTFASVRLRVDNHRWRDTPVYLTSGKALEEREAYVRFVFKNGEELLFNVQGGGKGTHVQATRGLPVFDIPKGWTNGNVDGTTPTRFITPLSNPGAYDNLVAKVWQGDTSHFVATDTLLASWRLWTPLLHELEVQEETPLTYTQGGFEMQAALAEFKRDWFRASEGQGQGVGHGEL